MILKSDYDALVKKLKEIETETGLYLTDEIVDMENTADTGLKDQSDPEYWSMMYSSACQAAGQRAENEGRDINTLIGYTIY